MKVAGIENAFVQRAYDRLAHVYDFAFGELLHSGRKRAVREMGLHAGQRVLEIGVGTGLTLPLYPPEVDVIGLDFSASMLAQARRRVSRMRASRHVHLLRADAARLPFADAAFDVVYAPYVISVVADPGQVGSELRRVCRPGGRVLLLNHFQSDHRVAAWIERTLSPLTVYCGFRTDLALGPLLAQCRLQLLSIQSVNLPPIWKLVVCSR